MNDVVLEGELSGHPFIEVLQLSVGKREPLKIELFDERQLFGEVYLDGPTLLDARLEVLTGIPALGALLRLNQGRFRVVRELLPHAGSLQISVDHALLECAHAEDAEPDERRQTMLSVPPPRDD